MAGSQVPPGSWESLSKDGSELGATSNQWDPPVVSTAGLVGVFLAFGPSDPGPGQLEKLDLGTLTKTGSIPADPVPGVAVFATP